MTVRPRGSLIGWEPSTARQKGILADLIARYEQHHAEGTLPRGPNGIFYDLRPNGMGNGISYSKATVERPARAFGPTEAHKASVQEVLALARRAGIVPERWVADTRAPDALGGGGYDESAEDYVNYATREVARYLRGEGFELDPQRGQPVYIEVLCEASDLQPRLARVAEDYGVLVYSGAGFDGIKGKRAFAERALEREVATVVLNVGDRDRHGENIFRAAAEDAEAWTEEPGRLRFERIAVTTEQAEEHDLLDADGKAEVDGLPVPVMDRILSEAIERHQDPACRERMREDEQREREGLAEAVRAALDENGGPR